MESKENVRISSKLNKAGTLFEDTLRGRVCVPIFIEMSVRAL
jgi:hypothetical protein